MRWLVCARLFLSLTLPYYGSAAFLVTDIRAHLTDLATHELVRHDTHWCDRFKPKNKEIKYGQHGTEQGVLSRVPGHGPFTLGRTQDCCGRRLQEACA